MSEQNLTQKEILIRLMDKVENLPALAQSVSGIEKHLDTLNKDVATAVERIGKLETENTQAKAYAVAVSAIFGVVITGVNLFLK
jgi:uncharacterized protein YoxC